MDNNTTIMPTTAEIPEDIKKFLESILFDAKMATDSDTFNTALLLELYDRLVAFINSRIIDEMPEDTMDELTKLLEEKRPQKEIDDFVGLHLPNSRDVYMEALMEFRDIYLDKNEDLDTLPGVANVTPD